MKKSLFAVLLSVFFACVVVAQDAPKPQQGDKTAGERPRGEGMRGEGMRGRGTGGTITAIDGQTITIKTMNGGSATIKLNDATRYMKDRQDAKLKDFKVGDTVLVRGEEAGENTWTAQLVVNGAGMMVGGPGGGGMAAMAEGMGKLFIVGEVKKIDELKLTILRPDGQTQVIEVDENTSFRKQGESVTLADIKVGDQVMGRGEVKNGVFIPKTLGVGNFQQMRMGTGNNNPPNPK